MNNKQSTTQILKNSDISLEIKYIDKTTGKELWKSYSWEDIAKIIPLNILQPLIDQLTTLHKLCGIPPKVDAPALIYFYKAHKDRLLSGNEPTDLSFLTKHISITLDELSLYRIDQSLLPNIVKNDPETVNLISVLAKFGRQIPLWYLYHNYQTLPRDLLPEEFDNEKCRNIWLLVWHKEWRKEWPLSNGSSLIQLYRMLSTGDKIDKLRIIQDLIKKYWNEEKYFNNLNDIKNVLWFIDILSVSQLSAIDEIITEQKLTKGQDVFMAIIRYVNDNPMLVVEKAYGITIPQILKDSVKKSTIEYHKNQLENNPKSDDLYRENIENSADLLEEINNYINTQKDLGSIQLIDLINMFTPDLLTLAPSLQRSYIKWLWEYLKKKKQVDTLIQEINSNIRKKESFIREELRGKWLLLESFFRENMLEITQNHFSFVVECKNTSNISLTYCSSTLINAIAEQNTPLIYEDWSPYIWNLDHENHQKLIKEELCISAQNINMFIYNMIYNTKYNTMYNWHPYWPTDCSWFHYMSPGWMSIVVMRPTLVIDNKPIENPEEIKKRNEIILIHEKRHALNNIIFRENVYQWWHSLLPKEYSRYDDRLKTGIQRGKDEIIAYLASGASIENIKTWLLEQHWAYDYYDESSEEIDDKLIYQKIRDIHSQRVWSMIADANKLLHLIDKDPSYTKEKILNILSITPWYKWGKLVSSYQKSFNL